MEKGKIFLFTALFIFVASGILAWIFNSAILLYVMLIFGFVFLILFRLQWLKWQKKTIEGIDKGEYPLGAPGIIPASQRKSYKIIYIIVLAVLVIAGIGERLLNSNIWNTFFSQKNVQIQQDSIKVGQTAGWRTYTNSEYGYQLQYPDNWQVKDASYTYSQVKNILVNVISGIRNDLPNYQTTPAEYLLLISFSNNKAIINHNGFVKVGHGRQVVEDVTMTDSYLKSTQEYKDAQKIIQSVVCTTPLICYLPPELVPITDNMITSFLEDTPDKTIGSMTIKKTLRADFDNNKREDAVVIVHECQATCYDNIYIFLNTQNGILSVDTSNIPLSKGIDVLLQGSLIEVRTFDLAGSLQTDQMYEVRNDKLTPVIGG